jgi:glutamine cyclotransferase
MKKYCIPVFTLFLFACNSQPKQEDNNDNNTPVVPAPTAIAYEVMKTYPHDTSSYTQGLIWYNNSLYEGTGREGFSKIAKLNLETGKAEKEQFIPKEDFGEGITILNNKLYQLTWKSHKVYVYDAASFKKIQEFDWEHEGWGITHDGQNLILSEGSSNLYYVDPSSFQVRKIVGVTDNYGPVDNLNELEYVNGAIYANKYLTNYILKINPETGKVEGRLDLRNILQEGDKKYTSGTIPDPEEDVLNGIAYDSSKQVFLITGKQWPALFEVKLK